MANLNSNISINNFNVNGINMSIKKQKFTEWFKKMTHICCLKETSNSMTQAENKIMEILYQADINKNSKVGYINLR